MESNQYDAIASSYQKGISQEKYMIYYCDPSFFEAIGSPQGLDVLDFGCGEGYFSRLMKKMGAAKVKGFDISDGMIQLAREAEESDPLGIDYEIADASALSDFGEFDLVVAKFVLHYAENYGNLMTMAANAYRAVKPGGRFLALVPAYERYVPEDGRYDFTVNPGSGPFINGMSVEVVLYANGEEACSFTTSFWRLATFRRALVEAGFRDVQELPMKVSEEGMNKLGGDFWWEFVEGRPFALFQGLKPS